MRAKKKKIPRATGRAAARPRKKIPGPRAGPRPGRRMRAKKKKFSPNTEVFAPLVDKPTSPEAPRNPGQRGRHARHRQSGRPFKFRSGRAGAHWAAGPVPPNPPLLLHSATYYGFSVEPVGSSGRERTAGCVNLDFRSGCMGVNIVFQ